MRRMYDAAYPPKSPPPWEVVAAYIGGDTPHIWTTAEWAAQPARWRLPIWTRSNPGPAAEGTLEGGVAALRARQLGTPPTGCAIALDYETAVDDPYLSAFDAAVRAAGYRTLLYGSLSTITGNSTPSGGLWIAHYTGVPHLESHSVATQYADDALLGTDYDASLVADELVLWDTRPAPAPTPTPEVDVTTYFPIQVQPDPTGKPNACGVASWPAGATHVLQLVADPGAWAAASGQFRLVFNQTSGPDVDLVVLAKPAESVVVEFSTVKGLVPANCRGVTITRPDGQAWPWGGGAE